MPRTTHRPSARPGDAGTTLVELLTAMVLFSLLLGGVGAFALTLTRSQATTEARTDRVAQATNAVGAFDRQLRSGNVLYEPSVAATPSSTPAEIQRLRIYTQANGIQKCVEWRLFGTSTSLALERRSWDPAWRVTGEVAEWASTATNLRLAGGPAFSVLDAGRRVKLAFDVLPPSGEQRAVQVSTSITGRNTEYGYNTQVCNDVPA